MSPAPKLSERVERNRTILGARIAEPTDGVADLLLHLDQRDELVKMDRLASRRDPAPAPFADRHGLGCATTLGPGCAAGSDLRIRAS